MIDSVSEIPDDLASEHEHLSTALMSGCSCFAITDILLTGLEGILFEQCWRTLDQELLAGLPNSPTIEGPHLPEIGLRLVAFRCSEEDL